MRFAVGHFTETDEKWLKCVVHQLYMLQIKNIRKSNSLKRESMRKHYKCYCMKIEMRPIRTCYRPHPAIIVNKLAAVPSVAFQPIPVVCSFSTFIIDIPF